MGCFHLLIDSFRRFDDAAEEAEEYDGGFVAWIDGEYQVRVGAYLSKEDAMDAAEEGPGVLLAVKSDQWEEVNARVSPYGVLTLGRPFSRGMFSQAVGLLLASQAKAERYRAENEKLRQKLEELRVDSREKCLLVEYLHLDEESAHKYMERQAMEERKTRRAVAEEILREYG